MCQLRINFPNNFAAKELPDTLEIETVPVCGTCESRDWCPIFIISIKKYAANILAIYPNKTDAIVKILFNKAKAQEEGKLQYIMVYNGVLDMIKNNNNQIKPLNINEGTSFMKNTFNNKDILSTVKKLMNEDMPKEAK